MTDAILARRTFLAGSGLAILGSLTAPGNSAAAELSESERANVKVVEDFCAAWSTRDLTKVTALMTDDSAYRMTETTPPAIGHAALIAQMQPWVDTSDAIEFRIVETFAKGPLVVNHRVDRFESKTRPLTWEGVGVFFVQNGKIKEWSDYTIRVERS